MSVYDTEPHDDYLAERQARWGKVYEHLHNDEIRKSFVYFLCDEGGRVLYVGRSVNPVNRWRDHQRDPSKPWTQDVVRFRKWGPFNHRTADRIEREQIQALQPIGNKMHTRRGPDRATLIARLAEIQTEAMSIWVELRSTDHDLSRSDIVTLSRAAQA